MEYILFERTIHDTHRSYLVKKYGAITVYERMYLPIQGAKRDCNTRNAVKQQKICI